MDTDVKQMRDQMGKSLLVSLGGFLLPFMFGFIPALVCPKLLELEPGRNVFIPAIFLGTAFSITGLPILVKTLIDLDIYATRLGMMTITAALASSP